MIINLVKYFHSWLFLLSRLRFCSLIAFFSIILDLLLSTYRHQHAGSLSLRLTGTASLLTTSGSTRRTACSGRSSARTPPTATHSAVLRSWVMAAEAIRASPISAPACSPSSTRFPSREPTSTFPWIWPAMRSPSLWCDGHANKATSGWPFRSTVSDVEMFQPSGNETRDGLEVDSILGSEQQCWVNWQQVDCPFTYHFRWITHNKRTNTGGCGWKGNIKTNTLFKRTCVFQR